jgi:hypothetical protein
LAENSTLHFVLDEESVKEEEEEDRRRKRKNPRRNPRRRRRRRRRSWPGQFFTWRSASWTTGGMSAWGGAQQAAQSVLLKK